MKTQISLDFSPVLSLFSYFKLMKIWNENDEGMNLVHHGSRAREVQYLQRATETIEYTYGMKEFSAFLVLIPSSQNRLSYGTTAMMCKMYTHETYQEVGGNIFMIYYKEIDSLMQIFLHERGYTRGWNFMSKPASRAVNYSDQQIASIDLCKSEST